MRNFITVKDIGNLDAAIKEAIEIKSDRFKYCNLGKNKTLMMVFFNSSLRTRLSTQKAALNLGMNVIVLDINQGAWKLETERGVIMDGDKPEHILEAIPVMNMLGKKLLVYAHIKQAHHCNIIPFPIHIVYKIHKHLLRPTGAKIVYQK